MRSRVGQKLRAESFLSAGSAPYPFGSIYNNTVPSRIGNCEEPCKGAKSTRVRKCHDVSSLTKTRQVIMAMAASHAMEQYQSYFFMG